MHPGTWGPAEWTATAALGTFAVALIASVLTFWQVLQAKRLYRDQIRPFVIVDYAFDHVFISISAKNTGATPARDVSIVFDPPLQGSGPGDPSSAPMFAKGIPMMSPGREMRVLLGGMQGVFSDGQAGKIPIAYKVTVRYSDLKGRKYVDPPLYLDLSSYDETELERRPIIDGLKAIETAIRQQRMGSGSLRGALDLRTRTSSVDQSPTTDTTNDPSGITPTNEPPTD